MNEYLYYAWTILLGSRERAYWLRAGQWCRPTRGGEPCRHSRHKYCSVSTLPTLSRSEMSVNRRQRNVSMLLDRYV